jgi:hypothetical protein
MARITEKQFRKVIHNVPYDRWDEPQYKEILDQYHREQNESLRKGTIVSGLISLALVGGIFIADALTPKDIKYERQVMTEQLAKEMPYGIR